MLAGAWTAARQPDGLPRPRYRLQAALGPAYLLGSRSGQPRGNALVQASLISIVDDDLSVRKRPRAFWSRMATPPRRLLRRRSFCSLHSSRDTTCLVTDVRMPGVSGIDLQGRLIDAGHRIPTIFMTAHGEEHMREAALKRGAFAFLTKPVSVDRLIYLP